MTFAEIRGELKKKTKREEDITRFLVDMYHRDKTFNSKETLGMYIKTMYPEFKDNADGLVDEALGEYEQQQYELQQTYNKMPLYFSGEETE